MASNRISFIPYQFGKTASCATYFNSLSPLGSKGNERIEIVPYKHKYAPKLAEKGKGENKATTATFVNDFIEKNKSKLIKAVMQSDEAVDAELISALRKLKQHFPICAPVIGEIFQTIEEETVSKFQKVNRLRLKEKNLEEAYRQAKERVKAQQNAKVEQLDQNFETSKRELQVEFNSQKRVIEDRDGQIDHQIQRFVQSCQLGKDQLSARYRRLMAESSSAHDQTKQKKWREVRDENQNLVAMCTELMKVKNEYSQLKSNKRELRSQARDKIEKEVEEEKKKIKEENGRLLQSVTSTGWLDKALHQEKNADIVIKCKNNEKVFGHSLFLKGKSKFIDAQLSKSTNSKKEDVEKISIDLTSFSKETVQFVIDYFYGIYNSVPLEIRFFAELLSLIETISPVELKLLQAHELAILNSIEDVPPEVIEEQHTQDILINSISNVDDESAPNVIKWLTQKNLLLLLDKLEIKNAELEIYLFKGLIEWACKQADDNTRKAKILLTGCLPEQAFPLCDYIDFTLIHEKYEWLESNDLYVPYFDKKKLEQWKDCFIGAKQVKELDFTLPPRIAVKTHWQIKENFNKDVLFLSIPSKDLLTRENFTSQTQWIKAGALGWEYRCKFSQREKEGVFQLSLMAQYSYLGASSKTLERKVDVKFPFELPSKKALVNLEHNLPQVIWETTSEDLKSLSTGVLNLEFTIEFSYSR